MNPDIQIRGAVADDAARIHELHLQAFDESERELVADLARTLVQVLDPHNLLALIAEHDGEIVGHIAFTRVSDAGKADWTGFMLSPLGVLPDSQGTGIGSLLINTGIEQLRSQDIDTLLVYGDPAYYGRFGFEATTSVQFSPPYPLQYPHGWQALELKSTTMRPNAITLQCVEPFHDQRLW